MYTHSDQDLSVLARRNMTLVRQMCSRSVHARGQALARFLCLNPADIHLMLHTQATMFCLPPLTRVKKLCVHARFHHLLPRQGVLMKGIYLMESSLLRLRAQVQSYLIAYPLISSVPGTYMPKNTRPQHSFSNGKQTKVPRFQDLVPTTSRDVGPGSYVAPSTIIKRSFNVTYAKSK